MGFTYQELKRIKKKSIVLEKQENIDIQQNFSGHRQKTSSLIRERFYRQPKEQTKFKDCQKNIRSNKDFCEHRDSISKILLHSLILENRQQQQKFVGKVRDTSQQLGNLEKSISHEIKKLQQQRNRLLVGDKKMHRKKPKKQTCPSNEQASWAEHLAGNRCKEENQEKSEIAKERFSLQHQCVSTSPRYGSDKNLQLRPRLRSVASQIVPKEQSLDQGALGDHNFATFITENKEKALPSTYPQIATHNDHIVNCCYCLLSQPVGQQTGITNAATNGVFRQHHNYQRSGHEASREYNYCRDEYYYNLPNCSCQRQCRTCTNNAKATGGYRRQNTDLNTQHFFSRPQDRTCSPEREAKTKAKKKTKTCKTKEFHEEYNEGKRRACEERLKKQRSKSIDAHEKKTTKKESLCQLLGEDSALKIMKYLDRYVDENEKIFKTRDLQISDESNIPNAVEIRSQTKLCQVTVRKKTETNKNHQEFIKGCDNVSLDTQYSLETLRMLKKMTIREYKPVKPKGKQTSNDLDEKQQEKVKRYREYLDKYERQQEKKKSIKILKQPPEFFLPQQESREADIFKQLRKAREEASELRGQMQTTSEKLQLFREAESADYQGRDKTQCSYVATDSSKSEEFRYEYGAAGRAVNRWDDYNNYRKPENSGHAKYGQDLRAAELEQYYKDKSKTESEPAGKQEDNEIPRKSRERERKVEDQMQETKQQIMEQLNKADFKEVKREPPYNEKPLKEFRKKSKNPRSRSAATQETLEKYKKSRHTEPKVQQQGFRFYDVERRYSKETKQQPNENLSKGESRVAVAIAEYEDEHLRETEESERKSNDQGSRYENKRREDFSERTQYLSKDLNNTRDQAVYVEETCREFKQNEENHPKSENNYYEGNRRDFEEYKTQLKVQSDRSYDFEGSSKNKTNADNESESHRAFEQRKQQSPNSYDFPNCPNVQRCADYKCESYRAPEDGELKPKQNSKDKTRYSEENTLSSAQQPSYSSNLKEDKDETITQVQAESYRESKQREHKPKLQEEINENRKIENHIEEFDEPPNFQEMVTKPSYSPEPYNWPKPMNTQLFKHEKEERETNVQCSLLQEAQVYSTKQESPRFSGSFVKSPESRTSPSQETPPKQEDQQSARLSSQNENICKEEPASYTNMELHGIEKKSTGSSYNEFKQIMDHNLGFYTSQTDNQFKPEVNEQHSSLTFTKEKETPNYHQDEVIFSSNKQEQLQEAQQLKEIPIDPNSLIPTTSEDALSYLKNFLKTFHRSGLEGEFLEAVTSAAKVLITKLSSCKSFVQSESTSKSGFNEHDESSIILESKVTQETQYKDPESTESSKHQLKHLKTELNETDEIDVEEQQTKQEPANTFLQQESYHYQSHPIDQQNRETLETYKKYVEYEENMPALTSAREFTNEQESQQPNEFSETHIFLNNNQYLETNAKLPLSYELDYYEPDVDRECTYRSLPSSCRQLAFDPELMPLKGILKPGPLMDNPPMASYDLKTHRTTSVVSFRQKDHINIESSSSVSYKLDQEEIAQQSNESKQTIIFKDEFLQPIAKQSKYMLGESTSTIQPMYQDCQQESELEADAYSFHDSPHLYTVEMPTFKQCPCMLDTYNEMMDNYYRGKNKQLKF